VVEWSAMAEFRRMRVGDPGLKARSFFASFRGLKPPAPSVLKSFRKRLKPPVSCDVKGGGGLVGGGEMLHWG
jgi:hypothetical protein